MSTDITLNDTVYRFFTTKAFATNIPTTLSGSPVVSVYQNNSTTQITAGVSLTVDFDGVTGFNLLTIVASAGNGFADEDDYAAVVTTGTVDSVSYVGTVVHEFSIGNSAAKARADQIFTNTNQNGVIVSANGIGSSQLSATAITEIADGVWDEIMAELPQAAPSATPTARAAMMLGYMALRNQLDVDTSGTDELAIYNDAGTKIAKKLLTDDGATYSEAQAISGA